MGYRINRGGIGVDLLSGGLRLARLVTPGRECTLPMAGGGKPLAGRMVPRPAKRNWAIASKPGLQVAAARPCLLGGDADPDGVSTHCAIIRCLRVPMQPNMNHRGPYDYVRSLKATGTFNGASAVVPQFEI